MIYTRPFEEIEHKINLGLNKKINTEQENYIAGLSDALEIFKKYRDMYEVGKYYFIIIKDENSYDKIERMKLYKIVHTIAKKTYCFKNTEYPNKIIVFNNENNMRKRVHRTYEDAENYLNTII